MARKVNLLQLYHIAHSYYVEGRDQDEIAAAIGLSRSQVSRLLDQARRSGIVRFEVRYPSDLDAEGLAASLRKGLSLAAVRIAPRSAKGEDPDAVLASFAATVIPELLADSLVIGVGWGRTIYQTLLRLGVREAVANRRIVPLVGSAGQQAPWLQINGIVDRLAEKLRAERVFIRTQAFLEADHRRPSRTEEQNLDRIRSLWNEVDTGIIGLGMPASKASYLQTEIDHAILAHLERSKAVGDILGRFYDAKGTEIDPGKRWSLVSLDLEKLKAMRSVICICRGAGKVLGIVAAAKKGFFKTLVTDAETADEILARSSKA
jgi:deoxyribonucleoside regulator